MTRALLAAALLALPTAAGAQALGTVTAVRDVVRARVTHAGATRPARGGAALHAGDVVAGSRAGPLQLTLRDGSVLTVGAAKVTLAPQTTMLAGGTLRIAVPGGKRATVETPAARVEVAGGTAELLVGSEAAAALARDAALLAGLACAGKPGCVDPATATIIVLRAPAARAPDRLKVTAGGKTVALAAPGVVVIGARGQSPSASLPIRALLAEQLDMALSTRPTPQEQRSVIDEVAKALATAAALSPAQAAPAAGRVVMDYQDDPLATQGGLARVAATLPAAAPSRAMLARLSLAVLAASDVPPVGVLLDTLAGDQGTAWGTQLPPGERAVLEEAVTRLVGVPAPPR